jgi:hypothetical protein
MESSEDRVGAHDVEFFAAMAGSGTYLNGVTDEVVWQKAGEFLAALGRLA